MDFLSEYVLRRHFVAHLLAVFCLLLAVGVFAQSAEGASLRKYAGIVVDAKTGKTLYSSNADSTRYPASVAKVMTLYILFEELATGRMKLDSKLTVSNYAASAVPTKLYLKPGSTIKVSDAIQALVTKSANDVARVVAENISGSVPKFAKRMTDTARALGMTRTTYRNPSGLPDSKQKTTVRDQARLGMAVFQHFPQYFKYFKNPSFRYHGKTYGNHNRLLGSVRGVDGIKTGFTNASGFNLLTSARYGNRHIIVAAFGFDSGGSRNAKTTRLVNKYLPTAHKGSYWRQASIAKPWTNPEPIVVALKGQPPTRPNYLNGIAVPDVPAPIRVASRSAPQETANRDKDPVVVAALALTADTPSPPNRPLDLMNGIAQELPRSVNVSHQPRRLSLNQINMAQQPLALLGNLINIGPSSASRTSGQRRPLVPPGEVIDPQNTGSVSEIDVAQIPEFWMIQVGATREKGDATQLLSYANDRLNELNDYRPLIQNIERNGQVFYRARFLGFSSEQQAARACNSLQEKDVSCLTMPGQAT